MRRKGLAPTKSRAKYGNKKIMVGGYAFDSKKEAKRFGELVTLAKAGAIENLILQPEFIIAPRVYDHVAGRWLPARKYIADFKYYDLKKEKWVVEDVKSEITKKEATYRLKRHLFLSIFGEDYIFMEV